MRLAASPRHSEQTQRQWPHPAEVALAQASRPATMSHMAIAVKKLDQLDLNVGELVEIDGRRFEVVPGKVGGLTLEPPITSVSELYEERGWEPASQEDFERLTAEDAPPHGEG